MVGGVRASTGDKYMYKVYFQDPIIHVIVMPKAGIDRTAYHALQWRI